MTWRRPTIQIDHVNEIHVDHPHHPFFYELLHQWIDTRGKGTMPPHPFHHLHEPRDSAWSRVLDVASKTLSSLSALAVIVLVVLLWAGRTTLGPVSVGSLLTVFSFTFLGGLVSIGGVRLFSVSASLRRTRERVERATAELGGCPFAAVIDSAAREKYRIRSPFEIGDGAFCRGCHLVDQHGRTTCAVSPLH